MVSLAGGKPQPLNDTKPPANAQAKPNRTSPVY
jgi:hypothetical protein